MKNLMKNTLILIASLFASMAYAQVSVAYGQEPGHLKLTTVVHKEEVTVTDAGERQRQLVEAASVLPGDSVVYTITFENVSDEAAENVTIVNPVPENLTYEPGSAFGPGAEIEFSVDGGVIYGAPEELTITDGDEIRTAQAEDYTHVRWVMQDELAAGAQGTARFRARLN